MHIARFGALKKLFLNKPILCVLHTLKMSVFELNSMLIIMLAAYDYLVQLFHMCEISHDKT